MNVEESIKKFKTAVLKDIPEFIGSVELYDIETNCYCSVGLALKNIGYNLADPAFKLEYKEDAYGIFSREFGLRGAPIGCMNDEIVRECINRRKINDAHATAPAREVLNKLFDNLEIYKDALASDG
jgi:hypothetical protein